MADFSDKADEVVGRAKQAAGDLTGNDELKAEGAADTAKANLKQGVDAVSEKAADAVDAVTEAGSSALETASDKADDVKASVSEAVDATQERLSHLADKTADTARELHLDEAASTLADKRVVITAVIASIALALVVRRARKKSRARRSPAKRVAVAGIGRALAR
ncbi:CsbD family protein [Mycolicibacterium sp.]|uniref:CsbD family protein n=1 Tax=Mycolicibacterium sp. TaxID=2320850 RepID=UPI001A282CAC|nr:CsbD family protein [Mycolicibacterium sp.]MBJ7338815.1 CsbD family protein [Mycolicibacterium sp.]